METQSEKKPALSITHTEARAREKKSTALRIQELLDERKRDRKSIADLESKLADRAKEAERLEESLRELAQFRAEREDQLENVLARVAKARDEGRKMFGDFDAVCAHVVVDPQAFQALLTSTNGAELMYQAGLGAKALAYLRRAQAQAQTDQQRIAYYRKQHQQHFQGVNNGQ